MYTVHGKSQQEVKNMGTVQSNENWKRENSVQMNLRLMKKTESDIIESIESSGLTKRARLIELLRYGIEYERLQKEGHPLPQEKPMPLRPVEKKKGMIDLRKVVRGTVDNPGSVPDPE